MTMSTPSDLQQQAAEAYAFRQLVAHLQGRTDVQNIEMMILTGFCEPPPPFLLHRRMNRHC